MKHPTIAPRPERSLRPSTPRLAEFESLDHAHRAALLMLQSFDMLLAHLQDKGLDDTSRALAKEVLAFLSGPGRHHHADEEKHVFPGLLAGSDVELVQHVRRLQQDHGWIEEDWRELHPQVEAIAGGYNWYDLPMLRLALPVFSALYHDHIALEESLVYPAAKRQREALLKGEAGRTTVM
jgi:hemerythrin-like domain-containing protein